MIKFKEGVPEGVLSFEMSTGARQIDNFLSSDEVDLIITSTSDGKHRKDSKHYDEPDCNAIDFRVWNILARIVEKIQDILGPDFDVVLEKEIPHIHVEYDPK